MSKPTSIELVGRLEQLISSTMSNICPVPLVLDGTLLAISYNTFSTNMDKGSIAVLQPLVMIRAGLLFLWVFTSPYILPEVEHSIWM